MNYGSLAGDPSVNSADLVTEPQKHDKYGSFHFNCVRSLINITSNKIVFTVGVLIEKTGSSY
jgi:hypothetical protein